jgi:hypothetical protein
MAGQRPGERLPDRAGEGHPRFKATVHGRKAVTVQEGSPRNTPNTRKGCGNFIPGPGLFRVFRVFRGLIRNT